MKLRREAKIGLFALLTLGTLYWGINYLRGQDLFRRSHTYYATYDQLNGLQKSSNIVVKGYKIGVVSNISYEPSKSEKIVVELNIKSKYKIPVNSQARIYSDGLLGNKAIEIIMGDSDIYMNDGDTLYSSQDKDFLELAGSELEYLKQKAGELVDSIKITLANINALMVDNAAAIGMTMNNLADISGSLNYVMTHERENMRGIVENLNTLSAALGESSGNIRNIIGNLETVSDSLRTADFAALTNNLASAVGNFDQMLSGMNNGQGTLGKLLSDDALYDSLTIATGNLSRLLEDLQERPGRYVQFSVFGRKQK